MTFIEGLMLIGICLLTFILWKIYKNTLDYFIDKKYGNTEVRIY
jgi:hypothetical protein